MRNSDGGFTLIEVLGAVAILAILYTTLSTVAIRGLRSEGESRRMLEASLLADWELSEFELELQTGAAPEIGVTQSEELDGEEQDDFTVTWEGTDLDGEVMVYQYVLDPEVNGLQITEETEQAYSGIDEGLHRFWVRARDDADCWEVEYRERWFWVVDAK